MRDGKDLQLQIYCGGSPPFSGQTQGDAGAEVVADPHQAHQHRKEGQGRLGGPGQQQRVADSQGAAAATADH